MVRSERQMNGDAKVEDMNPLYGVDGIRILIILYTSSLIGVNFQRLDNVVFFHPSFCDSSVQQVL